MIMTRALAGYREARSLDPTLIGVVIEHLELLITVGTTWWCWPRSTPCRTPSGPSP